MNIEQIVEEAQAAFWARVVELVPSAKSGDFPPDAEAMFNAACEKAVATWLKLNAM